MGKRTNGRVGRPLARDYKEVLRKAVELLGVGVETRVNLADLASTVDCQRDAMGELLQVAEAVGGLNRHYVWNTERQKNGLPNGRFMVMAFTMSAETIIRRFTELTGEEFAYPEKALHALRRSGIRTGGSQGSARTTVAPPPPAPVAPPHVSGVIASVGEEAPSPFSGLRTFRKDEGEALIEAARQYMRRADFVEEELTRFAQMGITIDRAGIHFQTDERMESVLPLIDYIDRLKASNERMSARVSTDADATLRQKLAQVQAELTAERDALRSTKETLQRLSEEYRLKLQSKDRRIKELEDRVPTTTTSAHPLA